MIIGDVIKKLEKIAPLQYQESYDNSGLLVGNPKEKFQKALVTLDCTEEVVEEAINESCNLIISHHPIIFKGLKQITGKNYVERVVLSAIKNDIAIYSIHTNLDNVNTGVNKEICDRLGLNNLSILSNKPSTLYKLEFFVPAQDKEKVISSLFEVGAGEIGNYSNCSFQVSGKGTFKPNDKASPHVGQKNKLEEADEVKAEILFPFYLQQKIINTLFEAHPYEEVAYYIHKLENINQEIGAGMIGSMENPLGISEFLQRLKEKMDLRCIKYTKPIDRKISKVAVCGGSGSFLIKDAKRKGADAYITSDIKYHEFFDAEDQLTIIDIGHYESEKYTKELLFRHLVESGITTKSIKISDTNTNPVQYYL